MPDGFGGALLQLAIALIASGVMVKLLTIRQDRRKIAGDASVQEANAASVLTGSALTLVENAQKDAVEARKDARVARQEASETKERNERLVTELNRARWRIYNLETRERILEQTLRDAGINIPPAPDVATETHDFPPPDGLGSE